MAGENCAGFACVVVCKLLPFSPPAFSHVDFKHTMAPFYTHFLQSRSFDLNAPSAAFKAQWANPSNYAFTVLLLLGGDVVSRSLAQLAGGRITPVAFSFGMSLFCICLL